MRKIGLDPRTFARLTLIGALSGCLPAFGDEGDRPAQRRVLAFWDMSASISPGERRARVAELQRLAETLGQDLWEDTEHDELSILPLHANTGTATALVAARFTGGQFGQNTRSRELASFNASSGDLPSLTLPRAVLLETDVLASIDRIIEYRTGGGTGRGRSSGSDGETDPVVEVWYFSDLQHSVTTLDFERRPEALMNDPEGLARRELDENGWASGQLSGVQIHVRLPGSVAGASGITNREHIETVERFWRALFDELGASVASWRR